MLHSAIRPLSRMATTIGLSGLAIVAFTIGNLAWLGWVLCAISYLYLWRSRNPALFAAQTLGLTFLIAATLLGASTTGQLGLPLAIAGLLLALLVSSHDQLLKPFQTNHLPTAHLDLPVYRSRVSRNLPAYVYAALLAGLIATPAASVSAWPIAGAVVIGSSGLTALLAIEWKRRRRKANHSDQAVRAALEAYAPHFAIYFTAPAGSEYQLAMWLPHFEKLDDRYVVILRESESLATLAPLTSAPIVVAPRIVDLEHSLVDSLKAVFYVNNGMMNSHCVRFSHLNHVQLLHGDSDKPSSYSPVTAMYSEIFVAGQAGIDRYAQHGVNIPHEKFRIVGRPQVTDINVERAPITELEQPTVLYAPTWTGNSNDVNYCSLPYGKAIVQALIDRGAIVHLRPHPFSRSNLASAHHLSQIEDLLASDARRNGTSHRWGSDFSDQSLVDSFNAADALICDVSAVAPDWLYSEKPFAVTDMHDSGEQFITDFPLGRAAYVLNPSDESHLVDQLKLMLTEDPQASLRSEIKTHYLGDFPSESYQSAFLDAARAAYTKD